MLLLQRIYHLNAGSLHAEYVGYNSNILDCGIIQNIFYMICWNVHDISSYKVHNSSFNGLLIITVELKDNYISCMATMLLNTVRTLSWKKAAYFSDIYYHSSFQGYRKLCWSIKPNNSTYLPYHYQLYQSGKYEDVMASSSIIFTSISWKTVRWFRSWEEHKCIYHTYMARWCNKPRFQSLRKVG